MGPGGMVMGEEAAQFAGFTTASYAGVAGGRAVMHARCAAAFAGSHLCHVSEYGLAAPATIPPAGGAWIDESATFDGLDGDPIMVGILASVDLGRFVVRSDHNCANWTGTGVTNGTTITPQLASIATCTTTHPLACCGTPFRENFRGFTTQTVSGARPGGRSEMHQRCGAQFAGSHMCFHAEYERANPTVSPPASGAWLDISGYVRGGALVDTTIANRTAGRFTATSDWNCRGWFSLTSGTSGTFGAAIKPSGLEAVSCASALPIACCD